MLAIQANSPISSVAFSKNGAQIVPGSYDKSVQVWDASTGAELQQLNGHTHWVTSVVFSHDGTSIVSQMTCLCRCEMPQQVQRCSS